MSSSDLCTRKLNELSEYKTTGNKMCVEEGRISEAAHL